MPKEAARIRWDGVPIDSSKGAVDAAIASRYADAR